LIKVCRVARQRRSASSTSTPCVLARSAWRRRLTTTSWSAPGEGEIVVTLDADFHAHLALSNAATPSVIRVRIEGLKGSDIAAVVSRVVAACEEDLVAGAMVTIDPNSIRVRRLPLATK
jgi:hypothetical protein